MFNSADKQSHDASSITPLTQQKPPPYPAGINLKSIALACLGKLIFRHENAALEDSEQQFLYQYYVTLADQSDWLALIGNYLSQPHPEDQAVCRLVKALSLSPMESMMVTLALAVEEDVMVGRVMTYLQSPAGGSRPTLGLLQSALKEIANKQETRWLAGAIVASKAVQCGVVEIIDQQLPLPEQSLKINVHLSLLLRHIKHAWPATHMLQETVVAQLPESYAQTAEQYARVLSSKSSALQLIRCVSKSEAFAAADLVCTALSRTALFITSDCTQTMGLGAYCLVNQYIPVLSVDLAPEQSRSLLELPGYQGVIIVLTGLEGHIETSLDTCLQWIVSLPQQHERQQLWQHYLHNDVLARQLASEHVHSAGRIRELCSLAQQQASLQGRQAATIVDVRQAAWQTEETPLGHLVQALPDSVDDDALVLSAQTADELQQFLLRCRNRETLDQQLGASVKSRYQMGVRSLFVGASGTGKTLAASWVAGKLGVPLYRVDLSAVVSKWIGETEKNLAQLLARAEQSEIVLLFDEADSLFGKRTDIKDANDRHANSQTNYLLQRIEHYRGIVILTSNSRGRFDSAFTRRLDKVIEFALPAAEQRKALWKSHLGKHHELSEKQLNKLAVSSELAGGHIRNVVLFAAVLAKHHGRVIAWQDVLKGLQSEYRKLGRQMPIELLK